VLSVRPILPRRIAAAAVLLFFMGPLELRAQPVTRVVTVGVLAPSAGRNPIDEAFEQSLQDRGWRRNHNIRIETRYAAGRSDAFAPLAAELVGLGADVLVAWSVPAAAAVKRATSQIPVVFLGAAEPVRFGLVSSLARPGANLTGVSFDVSEDIYVKRLELLKAAVPGLTRVALLVSAGTPRAVDTRTVVAAAKQRLNLDVHEIEVRAGAADFEAAVLRAKEQRAQALYVWTHNPFVWGPELSELAIRHRLPSIHWFRRAQWRAGCSPTRPVSRTLLSEAPGTSTGSCEGPGQPSSRSSSPPSSSSSST
jgi:putative ABC transport system substrate-binding protein